MRGIWLLLFMLVVAPAAHAGTVVVMTERAAELGAALEVALASRRVDVTRLPSPAGDLRLDRAAAAQRAAVAAGADAAVWIDLDGTTDVCAVSSDGRYFRHAPIEEVSPRMFAAIATSLLDELLAPPEGALDVTVDVRVNVAPAPTTVAVAPQPPGSAPVDTVAPPAPSPYPVRHDRTLVEIGPMLTPITYGAEATVLFPLGRHWRIGAMGTINLVFEESIPVYGGAVELRHVGSGQRRHFDLGFLAGAASAEGDAIAFAGVRLNWMWESATRGTSFSIVPIALFVDDGSSDGPVFPGIWASLRWGFPL